MPPESSSNPKNGHLADQKAKSGSDIDPEGHEAKVARKLASMPEACRATYRRAMSGQSRMAGVKAHCQECFCYSEYRANVRDCTITTCPLYPYRPYQKKD